MVRTLASSQFKTAWMFVKKGEKGHRKLGPIFIESTKWPGQNREFPELSPNYDHEDSRDFKCVRPTGYTDKRTGKFIRIPELTPELVVPDLSNFDLKPYVSYRTDVKIQQRIQKFEENLVKYGSEEKAIENSSDNEVWPPPPIDAKLLFDCFYADKIRETYGKEPPRRKFAERPSNNLIHNLRDFFQK